MTTQDLEQIGKLLDAKLDAKIEPLQKDITSLRQEVSAIDQRVSAIDRKIDTLERNLMKKISATQEDTIKALSEVINEAYFLHDKRITHIEDHLGLIHRN